jgi:hypothetical protein
MKCVTGEDGYDLLRGIHEGVCGNHTASRTLVGKVYRACFWWPTAASDAEDLCGDAKTANSLASNLMSLPTILSPYHHPGHLPVGALI